ncbi:uncharacterized protein LTR77_006633 [Saxophila tyrrhenica]|uniref:DNA recombination and repair protein Rad51-like C-terminal domain-containing protein n=1 Tax=Saxophila tyrrhenica TaxID=1690608 RepID=A0AAV9P577_9PEZI|nr:hypothetical protein LTR77_006633 [Saxophila tyrrhenica]
MAADVGKSLLREVEEAGLGESIRFENEPKVQPFNFSPLDRLLQAVTEARPTTKGTTPQPLVEILSPAAGDGKTHLLYHLCAQAVLSRRLGGKQAAAVVIDTTGRFDVPRLAIQIQKLLRDRVEQSANDLDIDGETLSALEHIHIFRPQALDSRSATLDALPLYLFDQSRHHSYDREVAFVALDPASAFYWQDRAESEDAAFLASTETIHPPAPTRGGYTRLFESLRTACKTLYCPAVITTWHLGPARSTHSTPRSFRPQLPGVQPTLRLVVRRLLVRKFPPGISLEQAMREGPSRQKAVEDGKFECFVNEWEVDDKLSRALKDRGGGFGFAIKDGGMTIAGESGEEEGNDVSA